MGIVHCIVKRNSLAFESLRKRRPRPTLPVYICACVQAFSNWISPKVLRFSLIYGMIVSAGLRSTFETSRGKLCDRRNMVKSTGIERSVTRGEGKGQKENSRSQLNVYLAWSIINGIIRRSIYPCKCTVGGLGVGKVVVGKRERNQQLQASRALFAFSSRVTSPCCDAPGRPPAPPPRPTTPRVDAKMCSIGIFLATR